MKIGVSPIDNDHQNANGKIIIAPVVSNGLLTGALNEPKLLTYWEVAMLNLKSPDDIPIDSPEKSEEYLPDNRKAKRMIHGGTIMLCDNSTDYYAYAQVRNVSGDGMYFETDYNLKRGRILDIRFDNPPFKTAPKNYSATVKWCKSLSLEESILPFGVGVKFL